MLITVNLSGFEATKVAETRIGEKGISIDEFFCENYVG
jgi:hypothetical protein